MKSPAAPAAFCPGGFSLEVRRLSTSEIVSASVCTCHVSRRPTSRCSGTGWRWRPASSWGSRTPCRGWRGCGSTWGSLRRTAPGTLRPRPSPPPSAGDCHAGHSCHDWCHAARGWGPHAAESCRGCCWRPGLRGNRILFCLEIFSHSGRYLDTFHRWRRHWTSGRLAVTCCSREAAGAGRPGSRAAGAGAGAGRAGARVRSTPCSGRAPAAARTGA